MSIINKNSLLEKFLKQNNNFVEMSNKNSIDVLNMVELNGMFVVFLKDLAHNEFIVGTFYKDGSANLKYKIDLNCETQYLGLLEDFKMHVDWALE